MGYYYQYEKEMQNIIINGQYTKSNIELKCNQNIWGIKIYQNDNKQTKKGRKENVYY